MRPSRPPGCARLEPDTPTRAALLTLSASRHRPPGGPTDAVRVRTWQVRTPRWSSCAARAPIWLGDQGNAGRREQREARGGSISSTCDRRATKRCNVDPCISARVQPVRRSRAGTREAVDVRRTAARHGSSCLGRGTSMMPALIISSLNLPIASSSSFDGSTPASDRASPLTRTMNRIVDLLAVGSVGRPMREGVERARPDRHDYTDFLYSAGALRLSKPNARGSGLT